MTRQNHKSRFDPKKMVCKLETIAPVLFEETAVLFAYLYGSYAQCNPHPFSDLDIGVFAEGLEPKDSLDLELSLSLRLDNFLDHSVPSEVRVLNHLPLVVIGDILTDGQLFYSCNETKRVQFETQFRLAYFDFLPIIRRHQNKYRQKAISEAFNGIS